MGSFFALLILKELFYILYKGILKGENHEKTFIDNVILHEFIGSRRNLLLFLDKDQEEQVHNEFNVSFQLAGALLQKPGDMIVSEHLLQNIVRRGNEFGRKVKKKGTLEAAFLSMFKKVQSIAGKKSIHFVNETLDNLWLAEEFSDIAHAPITKYKQVAFNYFCHYILQQASDWRCIKKDNGLFYCTCESKKELLCINLIYLAQKNKALL